MQTNSIQENANSFLSSLNPEQLEAATAPDGPLLILAAAGTGKTRTLVYRVVHLVERGYSPSELMLITFTNRAAREMLERAAHLVGGDVGGLWGGTFHHAANRMLRRHAERLGYGLTCGGWDAACIPPSPHCDELYIEATYRFDTFWYC